MGIGNHEIKRKLMEKDPHCFYCRRSLTNNIWNQEEILNKVGIRIIDNPRIIADDYATIDHVIPSSKGGSNDETNLVLACSSCNCEKGDQITAVLI